ncbi:MAG: DNA internalization-related competence protein ComEC/Rec2 [Lachnospiraceae bacterium]|nr:DNA internalization-related competence protein ComEC/Rec2 [Lachnospiraceae bacterium]
MYILDDYFKEAETLSCEVSGKIDTFNITSSTDKYTGEEVISYKVIIKNVVIEPATFNSDAKNSTYKFKKLVFYCDSDKLLMPGNIISFKANLKKLNKRTNPGNYDEESYYRAKKIYYKAEPTSEITLKSRNKNVINSFLFSLKNQMRNIYNKTLDKKEAGIVSAMILGEKSTLDSDIKELYSINGISHILAISGLHISVIGVFIFALLKRLNVSLEVASIVTIIVILLYADMTGFIISANRAVIMLMFSLFTTINKRTYDNVSILSFAALFILVNSPYQLFSSGFLLSFFAVVGIIFHEDKDEDSFLLSSLKFSFSINLFTLPIIMYYFYEIPPYGILLNLIVIPLASIVVSMSFSVGVVGSGIIFISSFVCDFFNSFMDRFNLHGDWFNYDATKSLIFKTLSFFMGIVNYILKLYELILKLTEKLPFHVIVTGCPSLVRIYIYYIFLIGFLYAKRNVNKGILFRFFSDKLKRNLVFFVAVFAIFFLKAPVNFSVTSVDVGQGDCHILRTGQNEAYMVDCGSTSVNDVYKYRVSSFLKYKGITRLKYIIMTHADDDHISGIKEILSVSGRGEIKVENLCMPDTAMKDEAYMDLVKLAKENKVKVLYIKKGDKITTKVGGKPLNINCLHPFEGYLPEDRNAYSTTLSMEYCKVRFLLTGDIADEGEKEVIQVLKEMQGEYDILKVAHHGSNLSTPEEFLKLVNPKISLISCGKNNRYGHPGKELLKRLEATGSSIYRTDESGAIEVMVRKGRVRIKKQV